MDGRRAKFPRYGKAVADDRRDRILGLPPVKIGSAAAGEGGNLLAAGDGRQRLLIAHDPGERPHPLRSCSGEDD